MSLRNSSLTITAVLLLVSCGGGDDSVDSTVAPSVGAPTPVEAVQEVVDAIDSGDFVHAATFIVPDQAALAALAEGASFVDVAEALRDGDTEVAANFWSGFAQGAGAFLTGRLSYIGGDTLTQDSVDFESVQVLPNDGSERVVWARDVDGYRVDIFASFGAGLADKMLGPVERLLSAQTDHTGLILDRLSDTVPSLHVASESPDLSVETRQQILALVELITRVG